MAMKKILILLVTLGFALTSCEKFLDENPDKSGSNIIYEVEQLDQMMNYVVSYLKGGYSPGYTFGFATALASDDIEFHPEVQTKQGTQDRGLISILDRNYMTYTFSNSYEMGSISRAIFHVNTVLDYLDKVSGDEDVKKQIEAEAKFYRAYFHFINVLTYTQHPALNNGENFGLAYREDVSFESEGLVGRRTIAYTMSRIYEDINDALAIFESNGNENFDINVSWRVSKVNLMAFKARLDLYNGKYKDAYDAATYSLNKYNDIYDFNEDVNSTDRYYTVQAPADFSLADGDTTISNMWSFFTKVSDQKVNNKEMFIPGFYQNPFGGDIPISESLYSVYKDGSKNYDATDLRYQKMFNNNGYLFSVGVKNFTMAELRSIPQYKFNNYRGVASETTYSSIAAGPSVPEMMLIRAECLSRGVDGVSQDKATAAAILQELRSYRFSDAADADDITGELTDVLNERRREMPLGIRWYDIKRLNALDNAGIAVEKKYFADVNDRYSAAKVYSFAPNSNYFAMPIPDVELNVLPGWEQNPE